jgi:hypothetical protein
MKQDRTSPLARRLSWLALALGALSACADDDRVVTQGRSSAIVAECVASGTASAPVLTPKVSTLWPPNHKFHTFHVSDCVSIAAVCDPALHAEFIWASSDEPVDDLGDGHFAPDIEVDADCGGVRLRAERQGPKDGRVYTLGVRVVDGDGHRVESQCRVIVDHDQRGVVGADSGEAYRITFDGKDGNPACDGELPQEPETPAEPDMPLGVG